MKEVTFKLHNKTDWDVIVDGEFEGELFVSKRADGSKFYGFCPAFDSPYASQEVPGTTFLQVSKALRAIIQEKS